MAAKHETNAQLKRRIADKWGFQYKRIVLMEASAVGGVYTNVSFQVAGIGYFTDFDNLLLSGIWNA